LLAPPFVEAIGNDGAIVSGGDEDGNTKIWFLIGGGKPLVELLTRFRGGIFGGSSFLELSSIDIDAD